MKHRITKKTHLHLRLVKGNRPAPAPAPPLDDGWPWRPPDPHARYDLPQECLQPRLIPGVNATGYEGPDWPARPDARYGFNTDE